MKKIKILHLNHISRTWSWAIMRILMQLDWNIFESHALVWYDFDAYPGIDTVYQTSKSILYRQLRYKFWVWINFLFDIMTPWCITWESLQSYHHYKNADIIHIHCPQGWYFNRNHLLKISKEKRVIMTIHDDRISSGNDSNNLYYPYKLKYQFNIRKKIFWSSNIQYVWVSNRSSQKVICSWLNSSNNLSTIYNWVNKDIFFVWNKSTIREALGIPLHKEVILCYAGTWSKTNMKWLRYSKKVMDCFGKDDQYLFISIWNAKEKKISTNNREVWFLDMITMSKYYQAADIFLYPTLMDSFWLVIAESISCWCPVVTFDIGWVPEIVQHKKNGYIAKYKDFEDLLEWFERVIKNKDSLDISLDPKFSQENMVNQYSELYKSLI